MSLADCVFHGGLPAARDRRGLPLPRIPTNRSRFLSLALRLVFLLCVAGGQGAQAQEAENQVHGRVLLPDGFPAQGATVSAAARVRKSAGRAGPIQWSTSVNSDSAGRFSLAYVPDSELEFTLTAALDGYLPLEWKLGEEPLDLGEPLPERRFEHAFYLTGSIVDATGELLIEGWEVWVMPQDDQNDHIKASLHRIQPDPDTGVFRVGPLAAGKLLLVGNHQLGAMTDLKTVDVGTVERDHVLLQLEGPDPFRSVFIEAEVSTQSGFSLKGPFSSGLGDPEGSYLFLFDGSGQLLAEAEGHRLLRSEAWCFEDVPPGEYTVELWHPLFERVRVDGVRTGRLETIQLAGNVTLEIDVLDSDLNRLEEFDASVRYLIKGSLRPRSPLLSSGSTSAGGKRFEGIVPGQMAVVIRSAAGEQTIVDLGLVQPNERRWVEARLEATVPLEVQVTDSKGLPVEGALVDYALGSRAASGSNAVDIPLTDAEGRCMLGGVAPGEWTIRAEFEGYGEATRTVQHPLPGGEPVVIKLGPVGFIEGQLRCGKGFDFKAVELYLLSERAPGSEAWNMRPRSEPNVRADGRFRTDELPVGQVRLVVQLSRRSGYSLANGQRSINRVVDLVAGEQEWELDLEPLIAASAEVRCTLAGEPDRGMRVVLMAEGSLNRVAERGTIYRLVGSKRTLDDSGSVTLSDLDPAATYGAFAVSGNKKWVAALGQVQAKSYLEPAQLERSLDLVEREILLRRAEGGSWAGTEFGWACQGLAPTGAKAKASGESTLTLRMPPGNYSLYRVGPKRPHQIALEWQSGEGPLIIEVPEDE